MKQVTLVSLYGEKTKSFVQLIQGCSDIILRSPLSHVYKPYQIEQIHGTIVGMERLTGYSEYYNARLWDDTKVKAVMDFDHIIPILRKHLPLTIQLGGFPKSFTDFESFGHFPYERSFQIQWKTKRFTLIGWSHKSHNFTTQRSINNLRDEIESRCHIRHKYRNDNDLFMVLGEITLPDSMTDEELSELEKTASAVESEVRNYLVDNKIDITLNIDDLSFAQYEVETLSPESTVAYRVTDNKVNAKFIESLYK